MNRLMASMALTALGLAAAGTAQAGGSGGHGNGGPSGSNRGSNYSSPSRTQWGGNAPSGHWNGSSTNFSRSGPTNYHLTFGKKFEHGYYYPGKSHSHWSYWCWDKRYGCNLYYDPCLCCYYYFCVPDGCYYPVTYCPYKSYCCTTPAVSTYAPTATATATAVATASAGVGTPPAPPPPPSPALPQGIGRN